MDSVMTASHSFAQVPEAEIQRSQFDRSFGHKTTFDAGYLIPVYLDEALPGDTMNLSMTAFARMATPLKAPMDNLYLDSFFFAVPYRLVWDNWKKFNGEQANPTDSTVFLIPRMVAPSFAAGGVVSGSLSDYMGIPVGPLNAANTGVKFCSLWHRAYNLIWNTWFRDQNLQNSVVVDTDDGDDTYSDYVLLKRGKRHDYFTSCLPWPQKGTAVNIPLGTSATVKTSATRLIGAVGSAAPMIIQRYDTGALPGGTLLLGTDVAGNFNDNAAAAGASGASYVPNNLYADLTNATAATINSLRQAFQLQKLYERDARGGTRYIEIVRAHFGVVSPDARMQRPEYLGGGSSPVSVNPIAGVNQLGSGATNQGNIGSFATITAHGHGFSKSFTEHCLLLGLVSVRADLTYQQGLDRMFNRRTRFDFYWPALAHIGEQSVLNKEIYCQGEGVAADELVFGYQERFAEYRYKKSMITGLFRSNLSAGATTLDMWHLSQNFGSLPTLADTFIKETPPVNRIVAVTTEPQFIFDSFFRYICARPMPVYGVPGMIDRF